MAFRRWPANTSYELKMLKIMCLDSMNQSLFKNNPMSPNTWQANFGTVAELAFLWVDRGKGQEKSLENVNIQNIDTEADLNFFFMWRRSQNFSWRGLSHTWPPTVLPLLWYGDFLFSFRIQYLFFHKNHPTSQFQLYCKIGFPTLSPVSPNLSEIFFENFFQKVCVSVYTNRNEQERRGVNRKKQ